MVVEDMILNRPEKGILSLVVVALSSLLYIQPSLAEANAGPYQVGARVCSAAFVSLESARREAFGHGLSSINIGERFPVSFAVVNADRTVLILVSGQKETEGSVDTCEFFVKCTSNCFGANLSSSIFTAAQPDQRCRFIVEEKNVSPSMKAALLVTETLGPEVNSYRVKCI